MQCTKTGVVIALRRRVERMRIPHERKESCLKLASIMASLVVTKKMCCRSCVSSRNSSTGCVGATVVDRKGASDCASSFLTAFIKSLGFKRILVRSDNERSLLSLIERVTSNLTGVELVLMTSPEGYHQENGLAEVGVREIKAQTRILRERLGSRIDEKDPLMSWIPRHAANCVSRYRIMDDGRTPDQRRCGKTWKRPVVEFGESVHFRSVCENNALRGGDQRLLREVCVVPHETSGAAIFLTPDGVKRGTRIAIMMEHERWDRVFSATCVGILWQLRPDQRNLMRPVVPEAEAEQSVAPVIVMPVVTRVDRRRYVTKRSRGVWVHRRMSSMHAMVVRHAQCEGSSRWQVPRPH